MRLTNKHVIITGGSSGIGFATAQRVLMRGASVSLIARNRARLADAADLLRPLAQRSGQRIEIANADVSHSHDIQQAIASLIQRAGPCDVLVTSAGMTQPGYFEQLDDSVFQELMNVNYFGTLNAIRAVVPQMMQRRSGSIVGISSVVGILGIFGYTAYAPSKFAVRGLLEALRHELKPYNITVSIVYPPDTDTPQLAYENQFKPLETSRISGTINPLSADKIGAAIAHGIMKRRTVITADRQSAMLVRLSSVADPVLRMLMDRTIRKARHEQAQLPSPPSAQEREG